MLACGRRGSCSLVQPNEADRIVHKAVQIQICKQAFEEKKKCAKNHNLISLQKLLVFALGGNFALFTTKSCTKDSGLDCLEKFFKELLSEIRKV